MKLIVCLDDRNGIAFNNRRQSSDGVVTQKILELVGDNTLWIGDYSGYLFADYAGNIQTSSNFLDEMKAGEYCFVENQDITPYIGQFKEIFVFRWNRTYPFDLSFPNVLKNGRILAEFPGKSHDKITLEVYTL